MGTWVALDDGLEGMAVGGATGGSAEDVACRYAHRKKNVEYKSTERG